MKNLSPVAGTALYANVPFETMTGLWECDLATEALTWSDGSTICSVYRVVPRWTEQ